MDDYALPLTLVGTALGALILGLSLGGWPAIHLIRADRSIRRHIERIPPPPHYTDVDSLPPTELAYLAGGARRVGQVALMDLLLTKRARIQRHGGLVTLTGRVTPYAVEQDPIRRAAIAACRGRVAVTPKEIVEKVADSGAVNEVCRESASRGLVAVSDELTALIERRSSAKHLAKACQVIGWSLVAACALMQFLGSGLTLWAMTGLIFGVALSVPGAFAMAQASRSSNPLEDKHTEFISRTEAGWSLLREATERYPLSGIVGQEMDRNAALRICALHGPTRMSTLGKALATKAPNTRGSTADSTVVAGGGEVAQTEPFDGEVFSWIEACDLASDCVGTGSSGGFGGEGGSGDSGGSDGGGGGGD